MGKSALSGRTLWLPAAFVSFHSVLIVLFAIITLRDAWDDMNPTMLVAFGLEVIDYPIHLLLDTFISRGNQPWIYLGFLSLLGTLFWSVVGIALSVLIVGMKRAVTHGSAPTNTEMYPPTTS